MKRRDALRSGLAAAAGVGVFGAAACGSAGEKPGTSAPRVSIRTLNRLPYEAEAWNLVSTDAQANVDVQPEQSDTGTDTAAYGRKLLTLAASDSLPDVFYVHPNYFSSIASRKLLADHEKLAAQQKFDLKGVQK